MLVVLIDKNGWLQRIISERVQRLGREFAWITLGQAAAVLGGVVGVRVITELLDPATYGQLALAMTIVAFMKTTLFGPLGSGATRFFASAREAGTLPGFLGAVRNIVGILTGGIVLLASLTAIYLILTERFSWIGLGAATLSLGLLSGANDLMNSLQVASRQRVVVALHQGLVAWGRFLVAAGLVLWLGATSRVVILAYSLCMLIVIPSQWFFYRRLVRPEGSIGTAEINSYKLWRTRLLSYSWPFAVWGVFTWAQVASGRWALQIFAAPQDVGMYAIVDQLGRYPIVILSTLMITLVSPMLFERAGDAMDPSRMRRVHELNWQLGKLTLFLTEIAVLVALMLHRLIFKLFVSPNYHSVSWLLPGVVLAAGLFTTSQVLSLLLLNETKSRELVIPKIITAIGGIFLSLLGAARGGVLGVVLASFVFSICHFAWITSLAFRIRQRII